MYQDTGFSSQRRLSDTFFHDVDTLCALVHSGVRVQARAFWGACGECAWVFIGVLVRVFVWVLDFVGGGQFMVRNMGEYS